MCREAAVAPPGVLPEGSMPVSSLFPVGGSRVLKATQTLLKFAGKMQPKAGYTLLLAA